ncbi:MAG: glycosyltransferase [Rhodospirillales bacterium]|nr:glycosyltransferase [Rhodospirillales bacterium]
MSELHILFVGMTVPGSRTLQRIQALNQLSHQVSVIPTNRPGASYEDPPTMMDRIRYRMRLPDDAVGANASILKHMDENKYDILWLERGVTIRPSTLEAIKSSHPSTRLVWYSEDDMMNLRQISRWTERALALFDLWVTTKSMNAEASEMPLKGVRNILFVNNSYDPSLHRPVQVSEEDAVVYGADVGFVGTFERQRAESLMYLARNGIRVRVWGNGWNRFGSRGDGPEIMGRPVYGDEYAKAVCSTKINLCFLRKENRDLQTCRSMELPAMGGFMLHERNPEICGLFQEGEDAVFFADDRELLEQCQIWLSADEKRRRVAEHGRKRVLEDGHSHHDRLDQIIETAMKIRVL